MLIDWVLHMRSSDVPSMNSLILSRHQDEFVACLHVQIGHDMRSTDRAMTSRVIINKSSGMYIAELSNESGVDQVC